MSKISILLVEDHPMVRLGIKSLLSNSDRIEILGDVSNGQEALDFLQENEPHVVVSDISMPVMNGLELAANIKENYPNLKVLLLTIHMDPEYIIKGFEAGIMGYLPKDSNQHEMIQAIEMIYEGHRYLTQNVSEVLAKAAIEGPPPDPNESNLTPREKNILSLLVEGLRNKEIAEKLSISVRTVDTHRTNVMRKLEVNNTAELVRKAINMGIV